jgi:uncharacterized membrane protein YkvA (DUF1232 family)
MNQEMKALSNYDKFRKFFTESDFWEKIQKVARKAGIKISYAALLLYYVLRSPATPSSDRMKIIGALGYFILPVDLIPDYLPVLFPGDFAGDAFALEPDLPSAAGVDAQDGPAQRGLAGAGFAHQGKGLPLIDVEIGILHSDQFLFMPGVKGDVHMLDRQDHLSVCVFIRHGRLPPYPSSFGSSRADSEWSRAFPAWAPGDPAARSWHSGCRSP